MRREGGREGEGGKGRRGGRREKGGNIFGDGSVALPNSEIFVEYQRCWTLRQFFFVNNFCNNLRHWNLSVVFFQILMILGR